MMFSSEFTFFDFSFRVHKSLVVISSLKTLIMPNMVTFPRFFIQTWDVFLKTLVAQDVNTIDRRYFFNSSVKNLPKKILKDWNTKRF